MKQPYLLYFDNLLFAIIKKDKLEDAIRDSERQVLTSSVYQIYANNNIYLSLGKKKNIVARYVSNKFVIL